MVIKMKEDYLSRHEDGRVFKLSLDGIRTYHRIIKGFDMFVYNLTQRGKSHGWVCIDSVTGSCIDHETWGHKLKEDAFKSATDTYNRHTREQILGAHQNALRQLANGKMDREEGGFNGLQKTFLYCWGCKTSHLMQGKKSKSCKEIILFKCPNCGFMNTEIIPQDCI